MLELDEIKSQIINYKKKLDEMGRSLWNRYLIREKKKLGNKIYEFDSLAKKINNIFDLIDLSQQENDLSLLNEIVDLKNKFVSEFDKFKLNNLLNEEYDFNNAIVSLHAGAGGTESCDWVEMLLRMYNKFTSFASCDVMPEINNDDNEIKILDDEIRVDTYRSSGAGGQHVNTTDSAIRITHLPTGIVVQCQNERSQRQNREFALNMLKSKLLLLKLEEEKAKINNIRGEQKEIAWGSQIRTYVFHPYNMVKDHRTNVETGNIKSVMEGEIDLFINAFLMWNK